MVVKPGKIDLVAENETQTEVSLVIERVNPGQAHQSVATVRTVDRLKRNRRELTLGAGVYVFYEESRPRQQGKIIAGIHRTRRWYPAGAIEASMPKGYAALCQVVR